MSCDRDPFDLYSLAERGDDDPHLAGCATCRTRLAERARLVAALPRAEVADIDEDGDWQARVWTQIATYQVAGSRVDTLGPSAYTGELAGAPDTDGDASRSRTVSRARRWMPIAIAATATVIAIVLVWPSPKPPGQHVVAWSGSAKPVHETDDLPAGDGRVVGASWDGAVVYRDGEPGKRPRIETIPHTSAKRTMLQSSDGIRVLAERADHIWVYRDDKPLLRCAGATGGPGCSEDALGSRAELVLREAGEYQVVIIKLGNASAPETLTSLSEDLAAVVRQGATYTTIDLSVR